ncbi:hypothetical protein ESCO_006251 [Escovopsis weberi]|uniref:Uncharacterized protein n=1 Tax=Escovopsis weberi TaxID=150374 RepID=A0A0M8N491_ESCWE|nr:hypothetical protein ESCO_006251 [Escovopsis weberi]
MLSIHPSEVQHYHLPSIPLPIYYTSFVHSANTILPMPHRQPPSPASSVGEPALPSSWGHQQQQHQHHHHHQHHQHHHQPQQHHHHHQHHDMPLAHSGGFGGSGSGEDRAREAADKERLRQEAAVAQALEIARESPDGASDPTVRKLLDAALGEIWRRVEDQPDSYVMTRHEFAVFNFFQHRFVGDAKAQSARKRYWDNARA